MAGKYHRTYLDAGKQAAFEQMQEKTGAPSNSYIAEAVRLRLVSEGYLEERVNLRREVEDIRNSIRQEEERAPRGRRRRRLST